MRNNCTIGVKRVNQYLFVSIYFINIYCYLGVSDYTLYTTRHERGKNGLKKQFYGFALGQCVHVRKAVTGQK